MINFLVYFVVGVLLILAVSAFVGYYYGTDQRLKMTPFRRMVDDLATYLGLAVILLVSELL